MTFLGYDTGSAATLADTITRAEALLDVLDEGNEDWSSNAQTKVNGMSVDEDRCIKTA